MNEREARTSVLHELIEVAPEVVDIDLDPDVSFRDQVDLDSVDYLQFVLALESRFGIAIPDVDYPRLSTLNGALRYIDTRLT